MEGIEIVADLLDKNGKFFNYESFCRKYQNIKTNFLQYQGLIHAIPREWKLTIDQGELNRLKKSADNKYWIEEIKENRKVSKIIYSELLDRHTKTECMVISKWVID